ncbi:MAG: hypothetical protein RIQ60_3727 [Pseudomonadota bacterium]|jgi:TfoX/Sxy family transcriptional regulator of competence genes
MSTDASYIAWLQDQIGGSAGQVSFRRMFGEYALYCDAKLVALVCDNQFYLKPTAAGRAALGEAAGATPIEASPYPGAKPCLLLGDLLEDRTVLARLVRLTAAELPLPAPKPPKQPKQPKPAKAPKATSARRAAASKGGGTGSTS